MYGLEVFALVVGIVSAFSGTASFLADRKKRKAEKARAKAEQLEKLQIAVVRALSQIQHEYDRDFPRIGPKFAAGDRKSSTIRQTSQRDVVADRDCE
jgi:Flp pilus assembly protein TadB